MNRIFRLLPSAIALLGVAVFFVAVAFAQQPDDEKKPEQSIHEQDIYIPYEKLREVFEKHGRGVFLPYEKFQELWRAAREKPKTASEDKPPVGALIAEIENQATVEKDVVRVDAKLKIEVLAEGWHQIPLRLSDAAISRATLGGRPARIIGRPGGDYSLLIDKKGKEPETFELDLQYARAIARSPGRNEVTFQTPQAPVSRWRVVIPQSDVKVELHPLIAATEVPEHKKDETVVLAFVGAAPAVRINWTPKAEGATGLAAMASVQAEEQVWIDEGVVRSRTSLSYSISRAELKQLEIDVPEGQKVANVFDANIRQWKVASADGRQRITAELFEPAKEFQHVIVELEKFFTDKDASSIEVPVVEAVGAGRQQGTLVVRAAESLRTEASKSSGLLQIDAGELPPALSRAKWDFAYRYASVPFALTLDIEKVEPRIGVDSLLRADLQPDRLTLDLMAVYTIERAGVFRLEWDIPGGYDVRHVRGEAIEGAAPAQVENHSLALVGPEGHEDGAKRLTVNLSRKAIGKVALSVRLQRELHYPELLTPTGKTAQFALPIPRVPESDGIERSAGRLIVYAPESLRLVSEKAEGLRSVSFREALATIRPARLPDVSEQRPVLAYAYNQGPAELVFAAERRKPHVTVRQLLVARVEEGVVKYEDVLHYDVRYSGVKSLRIDVPASVAGLMRVATPGVREETITPPPEDLEENYVAWRLSGDAEFLGKGEIKLTWESKIDNLDVGKDIPFDIPRLVPRETDRAWGQIALVKSETIDVNASGEPKNLRPIDPRRDLIEPVPSAAQAFEFQDDWALRVAATRYELEDVKRTSVELALVRTVVTQADTISVQAIYRMRSARQRVTIQLPPNATFDAQPLWINGRTANLEKGGENIFNIPLAGIDAEKPFVVEIRYTLPGDGRRIEPPFFPDEPAIVREYLCVYLPETVRLLTAKGPWNNEFSWYCDEWFRWHPLPEPDIDMLIGRIREGIPGADGAGDFAADGRPFLFSTLRPAPPPEGELRLAMIDSRLLNGLVFVITVLLGIMLLPAKLSCRAFVVGAAIVAVVLAGAFMPILSMQILNGVLLSAIFIVAVMWTVAAIAHCAGRCPANSAKARRDHGVDLSQYRPEPPVAEKAVEEKTETPRQDDNAEGGDGNA